MDRRTFLAALAAAGITGLPGCQRSVVAPTASELALLDAIDQALLIENGDISALESIDAAIARIEAINPKLNAVITTAFEQARQRATLENTSRLHGVPTLIKDLNPYKGLRFTRGSKAFLDAVAEAQSPYTDKIDDSGMIVVGKTNTPEFGLLPTTEPLALGPARNPWNTDYMTGGSSGGSAAAVAARLVPIAQASDGGGSIRIPAAMCGVFGLKPSRGRFPSQGYGQRVWPLSIKHMVSNTVRDSALVLALTEAGAEGALPSIGYVTPEQARPLKIAMSLKNVRGEMPDPAIRDAVEKAARQLEALGHEIIPTDDTPANDQGFFDQFTVIWAKGTADAYDYVAYVTGADPHESELLEPATIWLADLFKSMPAEALPLALEKMQSVTDEVNHWFDGYDAWLSPVTGTPPQLLGQLAPDVEMNTLIDRVTRFAGYTQVHNAAGTPAMSVPFGWTEDGLPLAVQLSSQLGKEALLLQLAYQLEEAQPWTNRLPPVNASS